MQQIIIISPSPSDFFGVGGKPHPTPSPLTYKSWVKCSSTSGMHTLFRTLVLLGRLGDWEMKERRSVERIPSSCLLVLFNENGIGDSQSVHIHCRHTILAHLFFRDFSFPSLFSYSTHLSSLTPPLSVSLSVFLFLSLSFSL